MQTYEWYSSLIKPSWAPPSWIFGPVWSVLYVIIFLSFASVFMMVLEKKLPWQVAIPFALNLIANFAFTPLQFGLRNNVLASIDILIILGTIIWTMTSIYRFVPWIAYAQIPYLVWVAFATCLQLTITFLNYK
ncbi:MAG: TspO/MBR family protein [Candidatus Peribacteraceae bacterium]